MSAIDFQGHVDKIEDPKGDREYHSSLILLVHLPSPLTTLAFQASKSLSTASSCPIAAGDHGIHFSSVQHCMALDPALKPNRVSSIPFRPSFVAKGPSLSNPGTTTASAVVEVPPTIGTVFQTNACQK